MLCRGSDADGEHDRAGGDQGIDLRRGQARVAQHLRAVAADRRPVAVRRADAGDPRQRDGAHRRQRFGHRAHGLHLRFGQPLGDAVDAAAQHVGGGEALHPFGRGGAEQRLLESRQQRRQVARAGLETLETRVGQQVLRGRWLAASERNCVSLLMASAIQPSLLR